MKTAHDLVAQAKTRIQEVALNAVDEAIQNADVLLDVREAENTLPVICPAPFMLRAACWNSNSAAAPNSVRAT